MGQKKICWDRHNLSQTGSNIICINKHIFSALKSALKLGSLELKLVKFPLTLQADAVKHSRSIGTYGCIVHRTEKTSTLFTFKGEVKFTLTYYLNDESVEL